MVTAEDNIFMLEWKVNTAPEAMTCWIELARLSLPATKMEAVLFTYCCQFISPSFCLKGEEIKPGTSLKYLELWFDWKPTFKEFAKQTAAKAERIVTSISWLMSNLGGPSKGKCKLLSCWRMLPCLFYMSLNLRWCRQCQGVPKNRDCFVPIEDCVKVCQRLSHYLHTGSLCAGRYTPDWSNHRWVQEVIQWYILD